MQPNRKTIAAILWVMLPLLAGAAIYLLLSPARRIFFEWLPEIPNAPLHSWIVYSLPDGLWAFSLVLFLLFALRGGAFVVATFATSAALMPEFLQGLHIFPGTFDWIDVIFILLSGGTAAGGRKLFAVKSDGGFYSLRPVMAGGGIIVFMILAMGTSEDKPYRVKKRATNTTNHPMTVYVSMSSQPNRLVTIYADSTNTRDTIVFYYLDEDYSGKTSIVKRCPYEIITDSVSKSYLLQNGQEYETSYANFMSGVEPYCASHFVNTRGQSTLCFTLAPGESFPFTYSEWHGRLFDETPGRYYSIYYTNQQGKDTSVFMAAPQLDVFISGQRF